MTVNGTLGGSLRRVIFLAYARMHMGPIVGVERNGKLSASCLFTYRQVTTLEWRLTGKNASIDSFWRSSEVRFVVCCSLFAIARLVWAWEEIKACMGLKRLRIRTTIGGSQCAEWFPWELELGTGNCAFPVFDQFRKTELSCTNAN